MGTEMGCYFGRRQIDESIRGGEANSLNFKFLWKVVGSQFHIENTMAVEGQLTSGSNIYI